MQLGEQDSFFSHWGNVEWVLGCVVSTVVPIAVFVWRLSVKVAFLEHMLEENDKDEDRRHEENIHLQTGVQTRIDALSARIDRLLLRPIPNDRDPRG